MTPERRAFPRYQVQLPVTVVAGAEELQRFSAQATILSRGSIQLHCAAALLQALQRQPALPQVCDVEFRLPVHEHAFRLAAQVLTYRRLSRQDYVLVLLFRHTDAEQERLLDRLLTDHLS